MSAVASGTIPDEVVKRRDARWAGGEGLAMLARRERKIRRLESDSPARRASQAGWGPIRQGTSRRWLRGHIMRSVMGYCGWAHHAERDGYCGRAHHVMGYCGWAHHAERDGY